ncbi:MAG: hypothetical protein JSR79_13435 [Proteobacteria bacterium]|nr:hypothetical protein [Pseudomonadota bacterium]
MKKLIVVLAGLGLATATLPSVASAAPWTSISQRQANLNQRIDQGVRSGALTRPEAYRLKSQLRDVAGLEYRYARSGGRIDMRERADLERRYNAISAKVRFEKHDRQHRW